MIRALARTVAILAFAAAVAGVIYAAVPSGGAGSDAARFDRRSAASVDHERFEHGPEQWQGRRSGRGVRHSREDASPGRGIAGTVGTGLQVSLIGAVVVFAQKRLRRRTATR